MIEKYTPKVGDKVRATLGESVLVGEVTYAYEGSALADLTVAPDEDFTLELSIWRFEQLVSVPSKFGAVIRRADGFRFTHAEPGSVDAWFGRGYGWTSESDATRGGFSVLFDGVDE